MVSNTSGGGDASGPASAFKRWFDLSDSGAAWVAGGVLESVIGALSRDRRGSVGVSRL
jgi:hypothetical protein